MAFFENIGKSITQAGQTAAKKTKDMTETVRINSAIAEEEKRLLELQRKIGEQYISLHASDYEKAFSDLMAQVQEATQRIQSYRQQLQDIKGFVPCKSCGAAIPGGAMFCSACGAPAPKLEQSAKEPAGIICPNCGTQNDAGACFCQGCGRAVQQPEPVQQSESVQQPEPMIPQDPEPIPQPEAMSPTRCPGCGGEIEEGDLFCAACGAKLQ